MRKFILPALLAIAALAAEVTFPRLSHQADPEWPQLPMGASFGETSSVAVDARGHVFVGHRGPNPIMEFEPGGKLVRAWGNGMFGRVHGLKFDREGSLWVVDDADHVAVKMDEKGRVRLVLGRKGKPDITPEAFNRPTDIAFAPNGDIYVTDGYGNSRVVKYTKDGRFVKEWGKRGTGEGEFNTPHGIAVDNQGRVYVGDRENYRMQVFDANGVFLAQWKHVGSPWGVVLTPDEHLIMADGRNNRLLRLTLEGKVLGQIGEFGKLTGQFDFCHHLAAGPNGAVYVAEIKNWRVQKFVPAR